VSVVVVDYDPHWAHLFLELRDRVYPVVRDIAVAIEHVGSTSVPGLCAKPIVDMDVIVEKKDVATAIDRLATIGYTHRGDLGVPEREVFNHDGPLGHNLYVCTAGALQLRNHLVLRGYLRAHPEAAHEYCAIKRALALRFPDDIDSYVAGKSEFILSIFERAGFSKPELEAIRAVNEAP
jgi:GrpB-like predicted nucleotidyltransferase (UPF0157 family)